MGAILPFARILARRALERAAVGFHEEYIHVQRKGQENCGHSFAVLENRLQAAIWNRLKGELQQVGAPTALRARAPDR